MTTTDAMNVIASWVETAATNRDATHAVKAIRAIVEPLEERIADLEKLTQVPPTSSGTWRASNGEALATAKEGSPCPCQNDHQGDTRRDLAASRGEGFDPLGSAKEGAES